MRIFILVLCLFCLVPNFAYAADPASLDSQMRELTRAVRDLALTVENQQREIAILKNQAPPPFKTPATGATAPASRSLQGRWNPDIGVVADTVLKLDSPKTDAEGADRVSVRELELVFGSAVDPYSRLDTAITFSDFEAASLEEAYLTRFEIPGGMTARVGRFKPKVGKAVSVHRDSLDTVDEPRVVEKYFGREGFSKSGVDLTKVFSWPFASASEMNLGVLEGGNGEDGTVFGTSRRRLTYTTHLKNFFDVSDTSGFELGVSYLMGSRDDDQGLEVQIFGVDATWVRHLDAGQSLKLQGESFYVDRKETAGFGADTNRSFNLDGTVFGAYLLADYRFHPQWSAGARFDFVEPVNNPVTNPYNHENGYTAYLTFYQSEFARWRVQLNRIDLATDDRDNQFLVQGIFAIGEHKHKLT